MLKGHASESFDTLSPVDYEAKRVSLAGSTGRSKAIVTILRVPKSGGIGTTKVKLVRWLKREGERVQRGEPVVELETEKVNYELDSPWEGVLVTILAEEADEVPVGDALCEIAHDGDAASR